MHKTINAVYVKFLSLANSEEGQDLVEYGLLCTLIALSAISSISPLAGAVTRMFTNISNSLA
jgi:Flp pilus assembly pilin Flp